MSKKKLTKFKRKPLDIDDCRLTGILNSVAQSEASNEEGPEAKEKYVEVENALPADDNQGNQDANSLDVQANAFAISTKKNVKRIYLNQNLDFKLANETFETSQIPSHFRAALKEELSINEPNLNYKTKFNRAKHHHFQEQL